MAPDTSGPLVLAVFPATIVLAIVVGTGLLLYTPPPEPAELPIMVQSISVVAPDCASSPPPLPLPVRELPMMVELVSVNVPPSTQTPAAPLAVLPMMVTSL